MSHSSGSSRKKVDIHHEPPAVLLVDIAFNLLIFFVVCASTAPTEGRKQEIPGSSQKDKAVAQQSNEPIEIDLQRTSILLNKDRVTADQIVPKLRELLKGRTKPEDRIVVVKSADDTPFEHWIEVTGLISKAGGVTTLQLEEQREVKVD
jgi:biopolymer transport protein ExbD